MKKIFLLLCCLSLVTVSNAQQLVNEHILKSGNTNRGFGSSTLTRDGNVLITGSYLVNPGFQSILTLVSPNADTLWVRKGAVIATGGIGIKQTPGGYTFFTTKVQASPLASGTALQKYDHTGQLKWTVPYQMNAFDYGYLLLSAPDSGFFLGGRNIINGKNRSFALSRTDSLGNLKWRKGYNWSSSDFLADMQHTNNNNIIMFGITGAPQRLKLLLVNQNGDSLLGKQLTILGSNRYERIWSNNCSITPLSDGGYLLAAEIDTSVAGASPYLGMVVKTDSTLQPVWHYINRSVPNNVIFTRSRELTDGTMVVLGFERKGAGSTPGDKFFLYRFSNAGILLNIYSFTSNIATQVQALTLEALSADSSFIIGGSGVVSPAPNLSAGFYVAKVKINGLAPALPLPSPAIVTGIKPDVATTKASLGQSYPNPTAAEAVIPYSLPQETKAAVITINEVVTGRQVKSYALNKGENSLRINLTNLTNGIYTYTLFVDEKPVATKKLSVVK